MCLSLCMSPLFDFLPCPSLIVTKSFSTLQAGFPSWAPCKTSANSPPPTAANSPMTSSCLSASSPRWRPLACGGAPACRTGAFGSCGAASLDYVSWTCPGATTSRMPGLRRFGPGCPSWLGSICWGATVSRTMGGRAWQRCRATRCGACVADRISDLLTHAHHDQDCLDWLGSGFTLVVYSGLWMGGSLPLKGNKVHN